MPTVRRFVRVTLALLAGLLALLVVALVGLRLWLSTPRAQAWAASKVSALVNESIAGRLEVDRLGLTGLATARARGVRVLRPEGTEAARAAEVRVRLEPWTLLSPTLVIDGIDAAGVQGDLDVDAAGNLGLVRAFAPRHPQPPKAKAPGGRGRAIDLRDLRLAFGEVRYGGAGEPPQVAVDGGAVRGSVHVEGSEVRFEATADAQLRTPVAGSAHADVRGSSTPAGLRLEQVSGTLPGGTTLDALPSREPPSASAEGGARGALDGLAFRATLPPGALAPWKGPALAGALEIEGTLEQRGKRLGFTATGRPAGQGSIALEGSIVSGKPTRFALNVRVRGLDPRGLVAAAPRGAVSLRVAARGALAGPPKADLVADLVVDRSRLRGQTVRAGRARISLRGDRWRASNVALAAPGLRVCGALAYAPATGPSGALDVDAPDLAALARFVQAMAPAAHLPRISGELSASVRLAGSRGARTYSVRVRAPKLAVGTRPYRSIRVDADFDGQRLRAAVDGATARHTFALRVAGVEPAPSTVRVEQFSIRAGNVIYLLPSAATIAWADQRIDVRGLELVGLGRIRVEGSAPDPRFNRRGPVDLRASADGVPLALLASLAAPGNRVEGTLSGSMTIAGTLELPHVEGVVRASNAALNGYAMRLLTATAQFDPRRASVEASLAATNGGSARLTGTLDAGALPLVSTDGLRAASASALLRVSGVDLAGLASAGVLPAGTAGRFDAQVAATGSAARPEVSAELALTALALRRTPFGPLRQSTVRLVAQGTADGLSADLDAAVPNIPAAHGHVELGVALAELVRSGARGRVPLRGAFRIGPGPIRLARQELSADRAALAVGLSGTLADPAFDVRGAMERVVSHARALGDVALTASGGPRAVRGRLDVAAGAGGGPLLATFDADLRAARWRVAVDADRTPLDFLEVIPTIVELREGVIDGRIRASGERGQALPEIDGRLALRADRLTTSAVGTLRSLDVELEASGAQLEIRKATALAQRGRVEVNGSLAFAEGRAATDLWVDLARFPLPTPAEALAEATTRAHLVLTERGGGITGSLDLSRGEVVLPDLRPGAGHFPTKLPRDIEVHRPGAVPARPTRSAAARFAKVPIAVRIRVPAGFVVRAPEANAVVEMNAVAKVVRGEPALSGDLRVTQGTLLLVGRRFQISRLSLLFTGQPGFDPGLDGQLTYQQRDTTVTAQVTGTVQRPDVQLTSNPPMDPSQIALFVASGGATGPGMGGSGLGGVDTTASGAAGAADAALSGAINVLAGQLGGALGGALPIDVLDVQLGARGEAERVEAGTYVTPRLFVAFVRNLFAGPAENFNEVVAEFQLRRSLSLRTRFGDRESGGVSLLWEKRFRSPEQKKR